MLVSVPETPPRFEARFLPQAVHLSVFWKRVESASDGRQLGRSCVAFSREGGFRFAPVLEPKIVVGVQDHASPAKRLLELGHVSRFGRRAFASGKREAQAQQTH